MSEDLDREVTKRMSVILRLIGVVAHDLGATMLPSVKHRSEGEPSKDWKRLAFQTEALSDHVKRQKRALDFFRAKEAGQLDDMELVDWKEWVWPMITSVLDPSVRVELYTPGSGEISADASHGLLVALVAYSLKEGDAKTLVVTLHSPAGRPAAFDLTVR